MSKEKQLLVAAVVDYLVTKIARAAENIIKMIKRK